MGPPLRPRLAQRATDLTAYQNAAYAKRYTDWVQRVREAETRACPGKTSLTDAVARNLYKLMAYKDEYEVARLHSDDAFLQSLQAQFEGDVQLHYHLAPPLLARTNDKGELVKQTFGPWVRHAFGVLKHLRFLRGTAFDVFGYTEERRLRRHRARACPFECRKPRPSRHAGAISRSHQGLWACEGAQLGGGEGEVEVAA